MKILPFIILVFIGQAFTAELDYLKYHQAFGIKASNISGYGAFYGFKPTDKLRLQATGIYYFFDHKYQDDRWIISNYSIGMEIQRDIIQEMKYRIYLMSGGYYYHDNDNNITGTTSLHVITNSYNCGVGIGYEHFFHRVSLGMELGYKYYYDRSMEKEDSQDWIPVLEKVSKIGAGLNLGFIF
jgi:hypothetical protein